MAFRRKICYVSGCPTEDSEPGIRFFHFPRTEERFNKWVEFCKNDQLLGKSRLECSNHFICSRHFTRDAFQNELLLKLNRNSYPTELPPFPSSILSPHLAHTIPFHDQTKVTIKEELPWQFLTPTCRNGVPVPDDEKVFQIASALKAHRDTLPWSCNVDDVDTLLMGLSEWEILDSVKRKFYFNRALTLYKAFSHELYSTSENALDSEDSVECKVSSLREEVCEPAEKSEDTTSDSPPSHPQEVTVVCVAFM